MLPPNLQRALLSILTFFFDEELDLLNKLRTTYCTQDIIAPHQKPLSHRIGNHFELIPNMCNMGGVSVSLLLIVVGP